MKVYRAITLLLTITVASAADKKAEAIQRFTPLVVLGDSLGAGFQNFSLFETGSVPALPPAGQLNGFAALVARQANLSLTLPLISLPGIPPALTLTPGGILRLPGVGARENPSVQATNLSVPGFRVADVIAYPFPGNPALNPIDALSDVILGSPAGVTLGCGPIPAGSGSFVVSQLACAMALRPKLILLSAGNNDALQALVSGVPPTSPAAFAGDLFKLLGALSITGAKVVMSNIPDVTSVPFLVPVPAFRTQCGFTPTGATTADFVVPDITNPAAVSLNICTTYAVRPAALVGQARNAVNSFNQILANQARLFGATVVDVNGLFAGIAQHGYELGHGVRLTTAFLGGIFSLDGIHPTNTGYAILANEYIRMINSVLNTDIKPVSVRDVANADPLVLNKPGQN